MRYKEIINNIKKLVLRDEVKSNAIVVSLYDLVNVLNEYVKPINDILNNKELLNKINEDIRLYSYFNKACNSIEEYHLGGNYKKNDYIVSKLGDSYSPNEFKFINISYDNGKFSIELLLSAMGRGCGIKISEGENGNLVFDCDKDRYNDFDIEIVKKYWEDFIKIFHVLNSKKDLFDNDDLVQVFKDSCLNIELKIDNTLYDLDTDRYRIRSFINVDRDSTLDNEYYSINHYFSDMFSISHDSLLKRISVYVDDLKSIFKDIYMKSINNNIGAKHLKKDSLNN